MSIPAALEPGEGISVPTAAQLAQVAERTMQAWALDHGIGLKVAGRWRISKVALAMLLVGDRDTLHAYRDGDRASQRIQEYYARAGVSLSSQPTAGASGRRFI